MERAWIQRQRASSQRYEKNSGRGSIDGDEFSFLLTDEDEKHGEAERKGSSEDALFGIKPMLKRLSSERGNKIDLEILPRRRLTQGVSSPTSDAVRRAWTTRRRSRRRTMGSAGGSDERSKRKRASDLRKLIAKRSSLGGCTSSEVCDADEIPRSPDIPPPEPPTPPPVVIKTPPPGTSGATTRMEEESVTRSSSSDVLTAAAARSAARRLSTGSGSLNERLRHRRASSISPEAAKRVDTSSMTGKRNSLRDLAGLIAKNSNNSSCANTTAAADNDDDDDAVNDDDDDAVIVSSKKKQRSWTMTRSFTSPTKSIGGPTNSFGTSQSSRNLGIATKPSVVSSHFSSSMSSLVFALLLKRKRTGWHMRSGATWVPRRFEIEKGMLKVFEHGSDHQSATMHLSHSSIGPLETIDTKATKTTDGSKFSSRKKSRVKLLCFVVESTVGEHEVIEIGSDDHDRLKQCHRAVKLAAVSPTFIQRRHLRYDERDVLGKGASGIVYKAKYFGTDVALKRLYAPTAPTLMGRLQQKRKENGSGGGDTKTDETMDDLIKELRLLSRFRHPNIISFLGISFDAFADTTSSKQGLSAISMVMEYCPYDLESLLHNKKYRHRWSRRQFVSIVSEITCGMSFLHTHGVIHRDLKPQNLMLTESLSVRIVDFGVSRLYADRRKTMTGYVGTPAYMSPEVIEGKPYDGCADVFSFAIILHEMWSGRRPYHDIKQQFTMMRKVCKGYRMPMPTTKRKRGGAHSTTVRKSPVIGGGGGLLGASVRGASSPPPSTTTLWPKALAEFIGRCWHHDPQLRPSFAKLDTIWRGDAMQKQIQAVKDTCWFSRTSVKAHKLLGLAPHASPDRGRSTATRKRPLTSSSPSKPPTRQLGLKPSPSPSTPPTRQLELKRDVEGRVGITFDDSLTILTATEWARRYGVRTGQRIVGCEGNPVRTRTDLVKYLPKNPTLTIHMEIVMPDSTLLSSSSSPSDDWSKTSDSVVQCLDGSLKLNAVQKAWFDQCMKPKGVKRTTTKALLMAMLIQLQA